MRKFGHKFFYFLLALLLISVIIIVITEIYRLSVIDKEKNSSTNPNYYAETVRAPQSVKDKESATSNKTEPKPEPEVTIPEKAYLDIPFLVQAPGGNWDEIHEETCEEASLIMVYHYVKNTGIDSNISKQDEEIKELLNFEESNGYKVDVTVAELSEIADKYYGLKTGRVGKSITIDDIKKEIANGKPVIIPAAGKLLPNPNFRGGGPLYHMLVVKGFDKDGFITNDPGTRKGKDFRYGYQEFYNAIHDWNSTDIMSGGKNFLVFD